MLAAAPPDAIAVVTDERRGCNTGEGSWKCGGGELRHGLLLLQRLQRAATSDELAGVQAATPAAVAATAMSQSQPEGKILQTLFIFPLFFTYWATGCEW